MSELAWKRVLVTGGTGFLGLRVWAKLKEIGAVVIPTSRAHDLRSTQQVEYLLGCYKPDVVIHCAARCGGIGANAARPADFFYENMRMGMNVIHLCHARKVPKLVMIGTVCSYPAMTPAPFKESDLWNGYPEETNAPYGIAKRALLTMCQAYRQQYGLNAIFLMPANLYGPGDNFDPETSHVIPAIIRKCVEARSRGESSITLWGDGTPTREFLYVGDAAEAIILAAERYNGAEPVNLGTGREISIADLASMIAWKTFFIGELHFDASKPNGQMRRVLDTSRAFAEFGWRASTDLETGLAATIDWYCANAQV